MVATATVLVKEGRVSDEDLAGAHATSLYRLDRLVVDVSETQAEAGLNSLPAELLGAKNWRDTPTASIADLKLPA